jgi:hypothetical protein
MKTRKSPGSSYGRYRATAMNADCKTRLKSAQTDRFSAGRKPAFTIMVTRK